MIFEGGIILIWVGVGALIGWVCQRVSVRSEDLHESYLFVDKLHFYFFFLFFFACQPSTGMQNDFIF